MYKLYCRVYQFCFRAASIFLPWRRPEILADMPSLAGKIKEKGIHSVLLVTDRGLISLGLHKSLLDALNQADICVNIFDKTVENPTIQNIEEALSFYRERNCGGIVALGGGSPMDCAKGVGARLARPNKSIPKLRGQLKVLKKMPFFAAIPTTAGTGSETTVAAIVTDSSTHEKYAINDPTLIPHYAVLSPALTVALPPHITATTGMDALVHAVEAYIGGSNTAQTRADARAAVKLIFDNILTVYSDGGNLTARKNMQQAAFLAGAAFTRAYVGNVHAIAHTLGGQYRTPHGLANAVILPHVLDAYGFSIHKRLAELSVSAGIADSAAMDSRNAEVFIAAVREMNRDMKIPETLSDLKREDIGMLAGRALKEANPLYPVPMIFDRHDMEAIYLKILEG